MVVSKGWELKKCEMLVREYKLAVIRWIHSGDLMNSIIIIVNNIV